MKKLIQIILLLALFNNSYSQSLISDFNYNVSYHKCFTANAEFCFDQSSTEDTDSVFWDFGDGIKIKVLHSNCASHRYTKRGSFAVKLTIWKNGIKNEIIKPDLIIINNPPSVSIDLDVKNIDSLYAPTSIKFRSYTKKGDGDSLKYSWTFQNNISTNDTCATFQFDHPDTYTISLNVTDNLGCSVTVSDYIIVKDSAQINEIDYIYGGCPYDDKSDCGFDKHFVIHEDTLKVYGYIRGNCCTKKTATVRNTMDTVYIRTFETGLECTCACGFCFSINELNIKKDSIIVVFNGEPYIAKRELSNIQNTTNRNKIQIYPIPINNNFTISFPFANYDKTIVEILDIFGHTVYNERIINGNETQINTEMFTSGLYIVRILCDSNEFYTKKILITK